MPLYEYECAACRIVYERLQAIRDAPLATCPLCHGPVIRLLSASNLNLQAFSSPTAAKYARMSATEEAARETELQKSYRTIWLPPPVRHNPWER